MSNTETEPTNAFRRALRYEPGWRDNDPDYQAACRVIVARYHLDTKIEEIHGALLDLFDTGVLPVATRLQLSNLLDEIVHARRVIANRGEEPTPVIVPTFAHFRATPPIDRTAILCRRCGSTAEVDHVSRERVRCGRCETEAPFPDTFALVRGRWADGDAAKALR